MTEQGFNVKDGDVIAVWFSCGAASAVAAKKTIERYGSRCTIRIINNPIAEEHEDNLRFLKDVENWLGVEIEIAKNANHPDASAVNIWEQQKYMSGVTGAPCTTELKKKARLQWEQRNHCDWIVLGFTSDEQHRYWNFYNRERSNILPILLERQITKDKCYEIIKKANIKLPATYSMASRFGSGFPNANCIGCVKASSPTYWNHVRETFPEIFEQRAVQSRKIGAKLVRIKGKRDFLDQLPPDLKGRNMKTMKIDCGSFCQEKEF